MNLRSGPPKPRHRSSGGSISTSIDIGVWESRSINPNGNGNVSFSTSGPGPHAPPETISLNNRCRSFYPGVAAVLCVWVQAPMPHVFAIPRSSKNMFYRHPAFSHGLMQDPGSINIHRIFLLSLSTNARLRGIICWHHTTFADHGLCRCSLPHKSLRSLAIAISNPKNHTGWLTATRHLAPCAIPDNLYNNPRGRSEFFQRRTNVQHAP